jgi:predicted restriction endonuclease
MDVLRLRSPMKIYEPNQSSSWDALLQSVDKARDSRARYFKPSCLLAVCSVLDKGVEPEPGIPADAVIEEFRNLVHPLYPDKGMSGWMPLWHLMSDGAWVCFNGSNPTPRNAFTQGKPKSLKQLLQAVDTIKLPSNLIHKWKDSKQREELKRRICDMLLNDDNKQANASGLYFAKLYGFDSTLDVHSDSLMGNKLLQDLDKLEARKDISLTTRKQLIDARLGQGKFRSELEKLFGSRCAVTGISMRELLRASHVLAWEKSDDQQRLDPNNGLLLSVNLDALFDKHLITFDRQGRVRVSRKLLPARKHLGTLADLRVEPTQEQWKYLKLHNATFDAANEE